MQQQNDGKSTVVLDNYLTKKEFYAEIRPLKFDNSGHKADILGLKIDISTFKTGISNLDKKLTDTKYELKSDILDSRKEAKEDLVREATSIRKEAKEDLDRKLAETKAELKQDILDSRKEAKEDLVREATSIRKEISDLTSGMCEQIQRVVDLIDAGVTIKQNI